MKRTYKALIRLYPFDYRLHFAAAVVRTFEQSAAQHSFDRGQFLARELAGLVRGAVNEWWAKLTSSAEARARVLPDWGFMRPAGVSKEQFFSRPTECL